MSMIETCITLRENQCFIRKNVALRSGECLEITPLPGMWLAGVYLYDETHHEHCWRSDSDEEHFVGLIDGMRVRMPCVREMPGG